MSKPVRASRRKYHIIYKTTCLVTNRYYIGMHSTDDLEDGYIGSGQVLWKSIKKYGKEQHICEILEQHPNREHLALREEELINPSILKDPLCMNLRTGGTGNYPGTPKSEETLKKISEASKRNWAILKASGYQHPKPSQETVAKRAAANTGKKRTKEQLANIAAGLQAYLSNINPEVLQERAQRAASTRAERGTNLGGRPKGIPMSEEQKIQQSLNTKGKTLSEEHKQNLKNPKPLIFCFFCKKKTTTSLLPRYPLSCV